MQPFVDSSHTYSLAALPYRDCGLISHESGFAMESHRHDFWQVIHVLAGTLEIDTGQGFASLSAGMIHLLPPGYYHALRSPWGYSQVSLNFTEKEDDRGLLRMLSEAFREPAFLKMPFRQRWKESILRSHRRRAGSKNCGFCSRWTNM
jgi:hypothetical protein